MDPNYVKRPRATLTLKPDVEVYPLQHGVKYEFRNKTDALGNLFMIWDEVTQGWVFFDWDDEIINLHFDITFE